MGVVLMMLIVVIPKVSQVFSRLKMELPITTKILIAASDGLMKHYVWVIAFLILFVGVVTLPTRQFLPFEKPFRLSELLLCEFQRRRPISLG